MTTVVFSTVIVWEALLSADEFVYDDPNKNTNEDQGKPGWWDTPFSGLYREATPERGAFCKLAVY